MDGGIGADVGWSVEWSYALCYLPYVGWLGAVYGSNVPGCKHWQAWKLRDKTQRVPYCASFPAPLAGIHVGRSSSCRKSTVVQDKRIGGGVLSRRMTRAVDSVSTSRLEQGSGLIGKDSVPVLAPAMLVRKFCRLAALGGGPWIGLPVWSLLCSSPLCSAFN
ncbi:predicted protein [Plenodomus lingam JN3]|uniref:Predicted protein n=1 Tax=Leptosphaeria maculans (strain JN3 / isolate v23.1.3 / race Av1-4-5-6-7-8) TaxID=985895 RepID=E5A8Q6_LEPMJ|nr:predicted protein [Plenodomus lingam JN3]CBY00001.1 predicted protein [Plenodomus lingam JN3]